MPLVFIFIVIETRVIDISTYYLVRKFVNHSLSAILNLIRTDNEWFLVSIAE